MAYSKCYCKLLHNLYSDLITFVVLSSLFSKDIVDLHQRFFRPANHEGNVVEASRLAPENALSSNTDQPHDPAKSRRRGYKHLTDSPTAVDGLDLLHHQNL